MTPEIFHYFPDLPEEIRREIWEWTFLPSQISLHCELQKNNETKSRPAVYSGVIGHKEDDMPISMEPGVFAILTVDPSFITLQALNVCKESRSWAKSDGYIPWKMQNSNGFVRNIMWNPKKDIVDFLDKDHPSTAIYKTIKNYKPISTSLSLLSIFAKQFPFETTEVRYIAMPSRFWSAGRQCSRRVTWSLIDFISLREFIAVVDVQHERACSELLGQRPTPDVDPWVLPDDLEQNVQEIREHYEKWGPEYHPLPKKPDVRVVKDKRGIFNEEDLHIFLRCYPCPYLGTGSQAIPAVGNGSGGNGSGSNRTSGGGIRLVGPNGLRAFLIFGGTATS